MRKFVLLTVAVLTVLAVAASTALAARGGPSVRGNAVQGQQACTGTLASGTYHKLVVPAGATCDGTDAVINVRGGVRVGEGATFVLGFEGSSDTGTIHGGVRADAPGVAAGPLRAHHGRRADARRQRVLLTVEDNVIRGGARIIGYSGFWLGFIRNTVYGTVKLNDNQMDDPDANEYVTNTIHGSLNCDGNAPPPQVGDWEEARTRSRAARPASARASDLTGDTQDGHLPGRGFPSGCQAARDTGRAMSQENVEIVRRVPDAYNRRDVGAISTTPPRGRVAPLVAAPARRGSHRVPRTPRRPQGNTRA